MSDLQAKSNYNDKAVEKPESETVGNSSTDLKRRPQLDFLLPLSLSTHPSLPLLAISAINQTFTQALVS